MSIPNGLVAAMGSRGSKQAEMVLWSHQFDSPIAAVWRLNRGFIQQVSVLSEEVMPELADSTSSKMFPQGPVMYIGDFTISFLSLKLRKFRGLYMLQVTIIKPLNVCLCPNSILTHTL